jgi:hypothetical protein
MRKKACAAAAVVASALAIGACGSSGSSSSTTSTADVTAFCNKVHELNSLQNPFASVKPGDVQGAKDALDKVKSEIQSVDAVAPPAVKSDVDKVQKTISDFAAKIASAQTPQQLVQAAQGFQSEAASVQSTVSRLKSYTHQHCNKG